MRPNIMQYSCHYHLDIFLVIATVCYDIFLIGWHLMHYMLIGNLDNVSKDVYINAHMVIIMNNADLLRLLMIYNELW